MMAKTPSDHRKPWTDQDDKTLRHLAQQNTRRPA
jgi:hypothetical protein